MDIAEHFILSTEQEDGSPESEIDLIRNIVPLPHPAKRKCSLQHLPMVLGSSERIKRCCQPGCSKSTKTYCEKCNVFLCLNTSRNCFRNFHKQLDNQSDVPKVVLYKEKLSFTNFTKQYVPKSSCFCILELYITLIIFICHQIPVDTLCQSL